MIKLHKLTCKRTPHEIFSPSRNYRDSKYNPLNLCWSVPDIFTLMFFEVLNMFVNTTFGVAKTYVNPATIKGILPFVKSKLLLYYNSYYCILHK